MNQVYTTYIRTTPEKIWAAITNPEFTRQYWAGNSNVSDWKKGSQWRHVGRDDKNQEETWVQGEVLESDPPHRLVLSWAEPENASDVSRVTFDIKPVKGLVCLTVTHGDFQPGSPMPGKVSGGWPRVLSSLKTLLETGEPLNVWDGHSCQAQETASK
jgi:uncharacterized protein YndB with AHSA1/START domain